MDPALMSPLKWLASSQFVPGMRSRSFKYSDSVALPDTHVSLATLHTCGLSLNLFLLYLHSNLSPKNDYPSNDADVYPAKPQSLTTP